MSGDARAVLFTDLDGTFLAQEDYLPGPALPALARLVASRVVVVFCSAKTRSEQAHLQETVGLEAPFIIENGAAIANRERILVSFGRPYPEVLARLADSADSAGVEVRGYEDMTVDEISELTGLPPESASRAKAREFSVTFQILDDDPQAAGALQSAMVERDLRMIRGAIFWSAQGQHDKGMAVRALVDDAREGHPDLPVFGIGDYFNDAEMLTEVDLPMLVQRPGEVWAEVPVKGLERLGGVGPEGWVLGANLVLRRLEIGSS